jgi:hypothetical protein
MERGQRNTRMLSTTVLVLSRIIRMPAAPDLKDHLKEARRQLLRAYEPLDQLEAAIGQLEDKVTQARWEASMARQQQAEERSKLQGPGLARRSVESKPRVPGAPLREFGPTLTLRVPRVNTPRSRTLARPASCNSLTITSTSARSTSSTTRRGQPDVLHT